MPLLALLLVSASLQGQAVPCADSVRIAGASPLPWMHLVEHAGCDTQRLADDITRAMTALQARAARRAPALVPRILADPPGPTPAGYGLLPPLTPDAAESTVPLTESRFAVKTLLDASNAERSAAANLVRRIDSDTTGDTDAAALEPMVQELERLKRQRNWLNGTVGYHRFWQKSADDARAFFAEKNALVARAQKLRDTERTGDSAGAATLRRALGAAIAPFAKTPNLAWYLAADGTRILPVTVVTDITDTLFVAQFRAAVQRAWSDSPAARSHRFRVDLAVTRIAPETLYPEGVPARGSAVSEGAHVARFPRGTMVLTTGGASIHAYQGRYIQLGTAPITPRVLAHEFGHLLGFADAYLRGTEGAGTDPFGFTIVEWTGIVNDLMGAPGIGRVTDDAIALLIETYRPTGSRPRP